MWSFVIDRHEAPYISTHRKWNCGTSVLLEDIGQGESDWDSFLSIVKSEESSYDLMILTAILAFQQDL